MDEATLQIVAATLAAPIIADQAAARPRSAEPGRREDLTTLALGVYDALVGKLQDREASA